MEGLGFRVGGFRDFGLEGLGLESWMVKGFGLEGLGLHLSRRVEGLVFIF